MIPLFLIFAIVLVAVRNLNRGNQNNKDRADDWEGRLINEFRGIVREPIPDPLDPRYKSYNLRERFPWGWEATEERIRDRLARQMGSKHLSAP